MPPEPVPRPYRLIALAVVLALIGAGSAYNAVVRTLTLAVPPVLDVVVGVLWAIMFASIALGLWQRRANARRRLGWALIGWIGDSLVRLSLFARADYDRERLPFLLLIGGIGCALIVFFLLRPRRSGAVITRSSDDE